ncbi:hypothetical protein H4S08_004046 [Coemansia sp. RSA 1365]|nr:hypothetical protein H4S08_004046 [Coemansia sp. RSA 1365]
MRFSVSLVAFSLASLVAASPVVRRDVINEIDSNVHYAPGEYPGFGGDHPGDIFPGGPGHDGPGHGDKVLYSVGDLLESPGINGRGGLVDAVSNLVRGLLGQPLDLHDAVDALTEILETQVPCLLDTLLPKP